MNTYIAIYNGKQIEVQAEGLYSAKCAAADKLKVPKGKLGLLAIMLAEKNGEPVVHTPDF